MDDKITELLEKDKRDRESNDREVGLLEEEGAIKYLNMSADDFNMMTIDELLSAASALNCLSFQVQRFQSDNQSSANRLERYLDKCVGLVASKYEGFAYQERKWKAIMDSKHLMELEHQLSKIKQRSEQHHFLAKSINDLATTLNKKADIKNRRYRGD